MLVPLFLCIGFMLAVLYIDLVYDLSALPYRKTKANLPKDVLDPILLYYGIITKRPWLLMIVMFTTTICIVVEIAYKLVPQWVGYPSIVLFGMLMLVGMLRVIPMAQRLASGKENEEKQTRLVHSLFPYHIAFLIVVLSLAFLHVRSIE
jgi:hypothetical protein